MYTFQTVCITLLLLLKKMATSLVASTNTPVILQFGGQKTRCPLVSVQVLVGLCSLLEVLGLQRSCRGAVI